MKINLFANTYNQVKESLSYWTGPAYQKAQKECLEEKYQFLLKGALDHDFTSARSLFLSWGKKALSERQKEELFTILETEEFEAFLQSLQTGRIALSDLEKLFEQRPDYPVTHLIALSPEASNAPLQNSKESLARQVFTPYFRYVVDPISHAADKAACFFTEQVSQSSLSKLAFTSSWKLYQKAKSAFTRNPPLTDSFSTDSDSQILRKLLLEALEKGHFGVEEIRSFFDKFPTYPLKALAELYQANPEKVAAHIKDLTNSGVFFLKQNTYLDLNEYNISSRISIDKLLQQAKNPFLENMVEPIPFLDLANPEELSAEEASLVQELNENAQLSAFSEEFGISPLQKGVKALDLFSSSLEMLTGKLLAKNLNPVAKVLSTKVEKATKTITQSVTSFANKETLEKTIDSFYESKTITVPDPQTWWETLQYPVVSLAALIYNLAVRLFLSIASWATKKPVRQLVENHLTTLFDAETFTSLLVKSFSKMGKRLQKINKDSVKELTEAEKKAAVQKLLNAYAKTDLSKHKMPAFIAKALEKGLQQENSFIGNQLKNIASKGFPVNTVFAAIKEQLKPQLKSLGTLLKSSLSLDKDLYAQKFVIEEHLSEGLLDHLALDILKAFTETLEEKATPPSPSSKENLNQATFTLLHGFYHLFSQTLRQNLEKNRKNEIKEKLQAIKKLLEKDLHLAEQKPTLLSEVVTKRIHSYEEKRALKKALHAAKDIPSPKLEQEALKKAYLSAKKTAPSRDLVKKIKKQLSQEEKRYQKALSNKLLEAKTLLENTLEKRIEALKSLENLVNSAAKNKGIIQSIFNPRVLPLQEAVKEFSEKTLFSLYPEKQ